jgi:hypothetical protein
VRSGSKLTFPVFRPFTDLAPDPQPLRIQPPAGGSTRQAQPRSSPQFRAPPQTCPGPSSLLEPNCLRAAACPSPWPPPASGSLLGIRQMDEYPDRGGTQVALNY